MKTKSNDRQDPFQFIGLLGPAIILLTLFCVLLKGTPKSSYLVFVSIAAFPALWLWRWKGFASSMLALVLFLVSFFPFFSHQERLWQVGVNLSVALGIFISFMGIEEVKKYLLQLKTESQGRLDNLMDLDEKFKLSQEAWRIEKEQFIDDQSSLETKLNSKEKQNNQFEKLISTLRQETEKLNQDKESLILSMEEKQQANSALESQILKTRHQFEEIEQKLKENQTDRELSAIKAEEIALDELDAERARVKDLEKQLQEKLREIKSFDENILSHKANIQTLQQALREKAQALLEAQEETVFKEDEIKRHQKSKEKLALDLQQKEHQLLSLKEQLKLKGEENQSLEQLKRDLKFDLQAARDELKTFQNQFDETKTKHLSELEVYKEKCGELENELQALYQKLDTEENQLKSHAEQVKELEHDKKVLEEKLKEQEAEFEDRLERQTDQEETKFDQLRKLNDTRFALFQASLDKERLKNEQAHMSGLKKQAPKHWLMQLESLLKGDGKTKVNFDELPQDLKNDLLTLSHTKALYKQLRQQFDEKNEILEEARKELFMTQTECEKMKKDFDEQIDQQLEPEKSLQVMLDAKIQEVDSMEKEVKLLQEIIGDLFEQSNE